MNHPRLIPIAVFVLLLLFVAGVPALRAQPPQGHDVLSENLFAPDLVMSHQSAIGLDENQKAYLRAEILKTQTRFTEFQWKLQELMEGLVELLKQHPADEAKVIAQLDKVLGTEREIKTTQITLMVRIKNKLTLEQQSRLRQIRAESSSR
ncbi:MAG: periplasmic heavy metal sensor [Acidobacteriota bacterium]